MKIDNILNTQSQEKSSKKFLRILLYILISILSFIALLWIFSVHWIFTTWSHLSMEELVYHLKTPLEGTNQSLIISFLLQCLLPTVFILILFILIRKKKGNQWPKSLSFIPCLLLLVLAGGCSIYSFNKLDVQDYLTNKSKDSTFIENHYVDPSSVDITFPGKKKNLIYIFLESMETTYADTSDGGGFDENIIPELTKLAQENEDFSGSSSKINGAQALSDTTWTVAAMFAQTSGLPLITDTDNTAAANNMDTQENFFPGITTLGDILEEEGYNQTLLIGSDATFAGRRTYFSQHGNYDILDYNYAVENGWIPEDYRVWWGYEDSKLFEFAKKQLNELSKQDAPFNLTMLTVDTHFEDGYVCDKCKDNFSGNQYANVMACSSRQVAKFVEWAKTQSWYDDTVIVISGDHPTMDSDFCQDVDEDYNRRVYTTYINAATTPQKNTWRNYSTFDQFPTTLAALGVEIEGNQLGLGTNLFSKAKTLTEEFDSDYINKEFSKTSKFMNKLANIEENEDLLIRKGELIPYSATVVADEYQRYIANLPVTIQDVSGEDIQSVMLAVWSKEDQSDLQWIETTLQEDGTYSADINIASFKWATGEYQIHAYAIDSNGESNFLGYTTGIVN